MTAWIERQAGWHRVKNFVRQVQRDGAGAWELPDGQWAEVHTLYYLNRYPHTDAPQDHWPTREMVPTMYEVYIRADWQGTTDYYQDLSCQVICHTTQRLKELLALGLDAVQPPARRGRRVPSLYARLGDHLQTVGARWGKQAAPGGPYVVEDDPQAPFGLGLDAPLTFATLWQVGQWIALWRRREAGLLTAAAYQARLVDLLAEDWMTLTEAATRVGRDVKTVSNAVRQIGGLPAREDPGAPARQGRTLVRLGDVLARWSAAAPPLPDKAGA